MKEPLMFSFKDAPMGPLELFEDIRSQMVRAAVADFERNRQPGVAYDGGKMVQRDGCFFIEWTPVGFERAL